MEQRYRGEGEEVVVRRREEVGEDAPPVVRVQVCVGSWRGGGAHGQHATGPEDFFAVSVLVRHEIFPGVVEGVAGPGA